MFEKECWLYRALHGRSIVFSKDIAERYTTMTCGEDVAKGISNLIGCEKAAAQTFHIASPQSIKWEKVLSVYLDTIEQCTGIRPNAHWIDNMDVLEKFMDNHYQVHYDRLFDRRFDSGKLEKICGVKIKYTPAEAGLAKCVSAFIKEKRPFKNISGRIQACIDKAAGETTPMRDIPTAKQKAAYFLIRHAPAAIALPAIKAARKARGR